MAKKNLKNDGYLSDKPITKAKEDLFSRSSFAKRIAESIVKRKDTSGIVLGIYGQWGDGKTSTLNLITEYLKKDKVIVTKFNPWFFHSESSLIVGFFSHIALKIGSSLSTNKEEAIKALKKWGGYASSLIKATTVMGLNIDPSKIFETMEGQSKEPSLEKSRDRINKLLVDNGKKIVVIIDDIDRLDKDEIFQIFKLVKLTAYFENVVYILSFDDKMVSSVLSERYPSQIETGNNFLEKIIQVPLDLPSVEKSVLQRYLFLQIDEAIKTSKVKIDIRDEVVFAREFPTSLGHKLKTPRQANRYINILNFALPILRDEVNVKDLMFIEGIRVFYPKLYKTIKDNPDVFIHNNPFNLRERADQKKSLLNGLLDEISDEEERKGLQHLLEHLFPRIGNSTYPESWEKIWIEEKRVCSESYFQRYFTYGIPRGDISDTDFNSFITKAKGEIDIKDYVKKYIKKHAVSSVVSKLRKYEDTMDISTASNLSMGLLKNSELFPENDEPFFSTTAQAIFFFNKTVSRITKDKRFEFIKDIFNQEIPTYILAECFLHLLSENNPREVDEIISKDEIKNLGQLLAVKIEEESKKGLPYKLYPNYGYRLMWHWTQYGKKEELTNKINKRLYSNPNEVADFLGSFVGNAYGGNDVIQHKSDFNKRANELLKEIISPEKIMGYIKRSKYNKNIDLKKTEHHPKFDVNQRIINQFVAIYKNKIPPLLEL